MLTEEGFCQEIAIGVLLPILGSTEWIQLLKLNNIRRRY